MCNGGTFLHFTSILKRLNCCGLTFVKDVISHWFYVCLFLRNLKHNSFPPVVLNDFHEPEKL